MWPGLACRRLRIMVNMLISCLQMITHAASFTRPGFEWFSLKIMMISRLLPGSCWSLSEFLAQVAAETLICGFSQGHGFLYILTSLIRFLSKYQLLWFISNLYSVLYHCASWTQLKPGAHFSHLLRAWRVAKQRISATFQWSMEGLVNTEVLRGYSKGVIRLRLNIFGIQHDDLERNWEAIP